MDIVKSATEWAKAEVFSSQFFIAFGILFILASIGFWQLGKTEMARAYIYPTLIAGILVLSIGIGIMYANKTRVNSFTTAYRNNPSEFVQSELKRTEKSMHEYQTIVFKIIPVIIAVCALLIIFIDKPIVRAICITTIAMMVVLLLVDSNANSRIENYHEQLVLAAR